MTELFENNAVSTLASGIGAGDTSLTVQSSDGAKYPSPTGSDFFRITLFKKSTGEIEIAKCTTRSGDGLTVITRGEEGTTPLDLLAGDLVELRPTAGSFASIILGSTSLPDTTSPSSLGSGATLVLAKGFHMLDLSIDTGTIIIEAQDTNGVWWSMGQNGSKAFLYSDGVNVRLRNFGGAANTYHHFILGT